VDAKTKRGMRLLVAFLGIETISGIAAWRGYLDGVVSWSSAHHAALVAVVKTTVVVSRAVLAAYVVALMATLVAEWITGYRARVINKRIWNRLEGVWLYPDWRTLAEKAPPIRYLIGDRASFDHRNPRLYVATCSQDSPECNHAALHQASMEQSNEIGYWCLRCGVRYAKHYPTTVDNEALAALNRKIASILKESTRVAP
jgi:hypothetical protein